MYARRGTSQWQLVAVAFTLLLVLVAVLLVVPGKDTTPSASNAQASEPAGAASAATPAPPTPEPDNPYPRGARLKMKDGVNLRVTGNLQGAVLATVPVGYEVVVLEGPAEADGYRWWRIETTRTPALQGWMAEGGWWERIDSPQPPAAAAAPTPAP